MINAVQVRVHVQWTVVRLLQPCCAGASPADIYEDFCANRANHRLLSNGMMAEASAEELPRGQTELPSALQRLWRRRSAMTTPLLEDNRRVLEDLLLQSAQVGKQRVVAPCRLAARQQCFQTTSNHFRP